MSEVIVRMGFHKNCLGCDLRQIVYGDSYADTDVYCSKENRFVGKRFGSTKDLARPDWCPVIGVLPEQHGRLGDLDRLAKMVNFARIDAMQKGSDTNPYWLLGDIIAQAKTIVPATERSKHEV